jgi:dipeptidase D
MRISELTPNLVWQYFEQLTQVPRSSKHEEKVIAFMIDFAKKHNLEAKKDSAGNVLIKKPASKGMENVQSVIFQSHLDMVCTANKDVEINFATDPIPAYVDDKWVKAKGTSLGADDGIGVAMMMAILTDETIQHGPVECLFTVDEETGLTGAFALETGFFDSKLLINLDSEEEGQIYIGCAGGIDCHAYFDYRQEAIPANHVAYKFIINGLKGGHSGDEIHKGLGNANKIANRFLYQITKKYQIRLSEFDGGDRHNAIPRFADFIFTVDKDYAQDVKADFETFANEIKGEFIKLEDKINLELKEVALPDFVINFKAQENLTNALYICPNNVYAMSLDIPGLTETSTNLAVVKMRENEENNPHEGHLLKHIEVVTSQRSSIESGKTDINTMVRAAFEL